jgi:hypothetical protein
MLICAHWGRSFEEIPVGAMVVFGRWQSGEVVVFLNFTFTFITPQNKSAVESASYWLCP